MQDLPWYRREVDCQYSNCHYKYFQSQGYRRVFLSTLDKYRCFRPVALLCYEQGILPKLYVEAQFYFLAEFYMKNGQKIFPLNAINTSKDSVERYNKFLMENKKCTGSLGVSPKDILEDDLDEKTREALLRYGMVYLKTGLHNTAVENAIIVDSKFKVYRDKDVAIQVLYSLCPALVPYLEFNDGWTWCELRKLLIELTVIVAK